MSRYTKYEVAKLIGIRAMQIEMTNNDDDPIKTAIKEYEQGTLPLNVRRHLPNGEDVVVIETNLSSSADTP